MAKLDFIRESEIHSAVLVEVGFKTPLERRGIPEVMKLIVDAENDSRLDGLRGWNGELTYVEITKENITLRFRYPTTQSSERKAQTLTSSEEEKSRESMRYLWYLFAKIDEKYTMNDVPFQRSVRASLCSGFALHKLFFFCLVGL